MIECDILIIINNNNTSICEAHIVSIRAESEAPERGSKHTLTPPTYLQGVSTHNPDDLRPWLYQFASSVCI